MDHHKLLLSWGQAIVHKIRSPFLAALLFMLAGPLWLFYFEKKAKVVVLCAYYVPLVFLAYWLDLSKVWFFLMQLGGSGLAARRLHWLNQGARFYNPTGFHDNLLEAWSTNFLATTVVHYHRLRAAGGSHEAASEALWKIAGREIEAGWQADWRDRIVRPWDLVTGVRQE